MPLRALPLRGLVNIRLTVSDTGQGMTPEVFKRAMEPFFTTKEQGTGLGLATVYGAVQHSGGVVAIQSALTKGTDVHLYFPKVPSRRFSCRAQETAGILVDDPFMSLDPRTRCDAAFCDPARPTSQRTPQASARAWFVRWFDTSMARLHRSARASLRRALSASVGSSPKLPVTCCHATSKACLIILSASGV